MVSQIRKSEKNSVTKTQRREYLAEMVLKVVERSRTIGLRKVIRVVKAVSVQASIIDGFLKEFKNFKRQEKLRMLTREDSQIKSRFFLRMGEM